MIDWKNKRLHFLLPDRNWCICWKAFKVIDKPGDQNSDGRITLNVHFHSEITQRLNMNSYMASLSSLHVKRSVEMIFDNSQACGHLENLVFETVCSYFLEVCWCCKPDDLCKVCGCVWMVLVQVVFMTYLQMLRGVGLGERSGTINYQLHSP